jgi:antitoxin component YwqK of YwqJK toxin-antitoxin module
MKKRSLKLFFGILLAVHGYSQKAEEALTGDLLFRKPALFISLSASLPPIESILSNPLIYKKQVAPDLVQATSEKREGQGHFVIHFRKKQLHDDWQSFYSNEQRCDSGRFDKGIPDGEWKTWYPNGQLKTVRYFNAKKYHYIRNDLRRNHPKVQLYAITRDAARNADRHFLPQYESNAGVSLQANLLQKIQHNTMSDGNGYVPPFQSCIHHGLFVNYDANGSVKDSGYYDNGLKQGLWRLQVNSQGNYAIGFFNHGMRKGQWKYYDRANNLLYTEFYKPDGKLKEWYYFKK